MAIIKKTTVVAKSDGKKPDIKASFRTMELRGKQDMMELPLAKKAVKKVEAPKAKLSTMEVKGNPKTFKESFKTMEIRKIAKEGLQEGLGELKPLSSKSGKNIDKGFELKIGKNIDKGFAIKSTKNIDKGFTIKSGKNIDKGLVDKTFQKTNDKGFAMKSPKNTDKGFAMKAGKNIDKGFELKITKKKK